MRTGSLNRDIPYGRWERIWRERNVTWLSRVLLVAADQATPG